MIQTILDFYNNKINEIIDARIHEHDESEKYNLTLNMLNEYVDTLDISDEESNKVFGILEDFFFNHLEEYQNIRLGLPNKTYLDMEENEKESLQYLHKLYGDK